MKETLTVAVYVVIAVYGVFAVIAVALCVVDHIPTFTGYGMFLWEWVKTHVIQSFTS